MKRIGVFVDVSNLYYCIHKKYKGRKLDYRKYLAFIKDLGDMQVAIAYGSQMNNQASAFVYCLKAIGFNTKFKSPKTYVNLGETGIRRKADWDVGIAIDIVKMIDRLDMVILGSGDGDMLPVVEWAMDKGVDVVVLASGISRDLKDKATKFIEIPESLLEVDKPKGAKTPLDMCNEKLANGEEIGNTISRQTLEKPIEKDTEPL